MVASKDHELFSLLQVFLNGGLADFKSWQDSHPDASEKYSTVFLLPDSSVSHASVELDASVLEHKIRLLTLASLGFQKVGQHVSYSQVAETLQVDISEVEKWIIDGESYHSPSSSAILTPYQLSARVCCLERSPRLIRPYLLFGRRHGRSSGSSGKCLRRGSWHGRPG